jgi:hypothetical protein
VSKYVEFTNNLFDIVEADGIFRPSIRGVWDNEYLYSEKGTIFKNDCDSLDEAIEQINLFISENEIQ